MSEVREEVRRHYASAALSVDDAAAACGCDENCACGPDCGCRVQEGTGSRADACGEACCGGEAVFGPAMYEALEAEDLPDAAVLASLGCGNPLAVADLHEGETVLDLGSGGGIDVLLSAKRVGATGRVFGLDMTDEMLALARRNLDDAGAANVVLLKGYIEEIPLPAASIDVVISNCVINLSVDKPRVFREMRRVLRQGGRVGLTDMVAANDLTPAERAERGGYAGCIAGALSFEEYERGLTDAGFEGVSVTSTHEVADGMFSAIIRATAGPATSTMRELPVVESACC
ncbi:MAG TPA: methyltransferase domain-containing protein [Actinomycetota bacterium]|nr:methyltransferase domain-containing protein [Actinomycetota bacterium]